MTGHGIRVGRPGGRRRRLIAGVSGGAAVALTAAGVVVLLLRGGEAGPDAARRGPPIEYPPGIPPPPVREDVPEPRATAEPEDGLTRITVAEGPDGPPGASYLIPAEATPGVRADGPTTRLMGLTIGGAQVDVLAFHRVPRWYASDELADRALVVLGYFGVARRHTPPRPDRMLGLPATTFRWGQPGAFSITEWHLASGGWWIAVTLFRDRRTAPADVAAARRVLESWRWAPAAGGAS